jgi:hypothetical protein
MTDRPEPDRWRFLRATPDSGLTDLSKDPRLGLLAACVANQQRFAGFKAVIDAREGHCPDCGASGFNTGMGVWAHTCGSEWHTSGEVATPCKPKRIRRTRP